MQIQDRCCSSQRKKPRAIHIKTLHIMQQFSLNQSQLFTPLLRKLYLIFLLKFKTINQPYHKLAACEFKNALATRHAVLYAQIASADTCFEVVNTHQSLTVWKYYRVRFIQSKTKCGRMINEVVAAKHPVCIS